MITRERDGVTLLFFDTLDREEGLSHLVTTRRSHLAGGCRATFSADPTRAPDRKRLVRLMGLRDRPVFAAGQVHGKRIALVDRTTATPVMEETDGLATGDADVILAVKGADCPLVLLYDPEGRALCLFHSGWRGTAGHIARAAVEALRNSFRSKAPTLLAAISPSIRSCCYEVAAGLAQPFEDEFPPEVVQRRSSKTFVSLQQAIRFDLIQAGVSPRKIEESPLCTMCEGRLLHSYRREGPSSGRIVLAGCLL